MAKPIMVARLTSASTHWLLSAVGVSSSTSKSASAIRSHSTGWNSTPFSTL